MQVFVLSSKKITCGCNIQGKKSYALSDKISVCTFEDLIEVLQ